VANKTLSTKETADALGITTRQLANYIKGGCPVRRMKPKKGKGGKPRLVFTLSAVKGWLETNNILPKDESKKEDSITEYPPPPEGSPPAADDLTKAGLVGALARLRFLERVTYTAFLKSVHAGDAPTVVRAKEKVYIEAHQALRRTEKEIPSILEARGESIPVETVLIEVTKMDISIKTDLLAIPDKVAERIAAAYKSTDPKPARNILRREIDDALRHIATRKTYLDPPKK